QAVPAAKGTFAMVHGPQRVKVPKTKVKRLTLKLLSSHGGPNPGASEIMAFAASPPKERFAEFDPTAVEYPEWMPPIDRMLVIQRHELNPSHVYTYHVEGFRPGGGLYVFTPNEEGGELERLVASPDGQILDCDLSHDGREILFSWKGGGREYGAQFDRSLPPDTDPDHMYRIYRMNVDGTGLEPLTDGTSNNMNPCWLPDGDVAFLSDRKPAFAYCFVSTSPTLYRMDRNGESVKRLSANYLNDFTPHVLGDGRIVYSRWEYVDRPAIPIQGLWSINPDGTALSAVFGNRVLSPATFMEARSIPGTSHLLCVLTSHNGPCRGAIGMIDRNFGPNAQEAIRNLTPEVDVGLVDQG
ncbi:MAG: TolB family protein, partial [Planctomycetota bacterium]